MLGASRVEVFSCGIEIRRGAARRAEVNAVLSGRDRLLAPLKIDGDSDAVWFLDELGCSDRVAFRVLKLCRPPPCVLGTGNFGESHR